MFDAVLGGGPGEKTLRDGGGVAPPWAALSVSLLWCFILSSFLPLGPFSSPLFSLFYLRTGCLIPSSKVTMPGGEEDGEKTGPESGVWKRAWGLAPDWPAFEATVMA